MMRPIVAGLILSASLIAAGGTPASAQGWNFNCAKMASKTAKARCSKQKAARATNVEKVKKRRDARDHRRDKLNATKTNN